jgi:peroxiredoxin
VIQPGDRLPSVPIKLVDAAGIVDSASDIVLGTGRVVCFAVPGAFTPTCNTSHLPGFIANAGKFRAAGVDRIVCVSVNDHHVMKAWAESFDALGLIDFIADGNGDLARALGLERDFTASNMGWRYRRAALLLDAGVVTDVLLETAPGLNATGATAALMALEATAHV